MNKYFQFCCFGSSVQEYSKLSEFELTDEYIHFPVNKIYYVTKLFSIEKSDISSCSIGFDHISINNERVKYDYIVSFKIIKNSIYIFMYGDIVEQSIEICDNRLFIKIIFPTIGYAHSFLRNVLLKINKYKELNIHDLSVTKNKSFKTFYIN